MAGNAPDIPGCRDLSLIGERVARSLFSAYSDKVGRPVTVTVYPALSEGRTRHGFDAAARTAQHLGAHPSVLTVHEWGHARDGRPYLVTEPQPAESVDTVLTLDGPLEVDHALRVGVLLAGALATAHEAGIVHGDLSPSRLVLGSHGEPLLAETGLAEYAVFPGLGALNNPVRYFAPPEVLERTDIGPATDVYALACTVYALLAGRAPHQKPAEITDSNASLLLRILQMRVPPIDRPDLPPGLDDALRGPLSADPGKRPQQAIEMAWLLQDVQRHTGLAVTEPVVLDLDDLGSTRAPASAPARESTAPAARPALPDRGGRAGHAPTPVPAPAPPDGVRVVRGDPAGAGAGWGDAPGGPAPDVDAPAARFRDAPDGTPPPTIFPFADGNGTATPAPGVDWSDAPDDAPPDRGSVAGGAEPGPAAWEAPAAHAEGPAGDDPIGRTPSAPDDARDLWRSPAAPDESASPWQAQPPATDGALWPATWPSGEQADELPAWAAPPPDDGPTSSDDRPTAPDDAPGDAPDGGSLPRRLESGTPGSDQPSIPDDPAAPDAPRRDAGAGWFAVGGDGGSIADAPTPPPPEGATPSLFTSGLDRPPELDQLPDWYTSPLPSEHAPGPPGHPDDPAAPGGNGRDAGPAPWAPSGPAGPGAPPSDPGPPAWDTPAADPGPPAWDTPAADPGPPAWDTPSPNAGPPAWDVPPRDVPPWEPPAGGPGANGNGAGATPAFGATPEAGPGNGALPRRRPHDPQLPGAGDELRSLFGEVVRDESPPRPGADRPLDAGPPAADLDPLGPPSDRPPIDLTRLDEPLGPAPYLPPGDRRQPPPGRDAGARSAAPRLPRRHEVEGRPAGAAHGHEAPSARPAAAAPTAPRLERAAPRQVAGADVAGSPPRPSAAGGPPALPLIILIGVVVVLIAGVAWLVLAGDDSAEPATRSDPQPDAAPADVAVVPGPDGAQVTWTGAADDAYVITVLTAERPPKALPAASGTSALVPLTELGAGGAGCVTVTVADGDGAPSGTASAPACTPGTTPDAVQSAG